MARRPEVNDEHIIDFFLVGPSLQMLHGQWGSISPVGNVTAGIELEYGVPRTCPGSCSQSFMAISNEWVPANMHLAAVNKVLTSGFLAALVAMECVKRWDCVLSSCCM